MSESLPTPAQGGVLPRGQGRSYGDTCLNEGGTLLTTGRLDRLMAFDPETGVLRCEAGTTLEAILQVVVPRGWFPAVTPGTKFVSVGGAIAHDVHGKNHHRSGTFGCHVRRFELLRSDGSRRVCSPREHPEWFAATIGGMGLTGLITWAELQLRRISSPNVTSETLAFSGLDEFFAVSRASEASHEFTVAWIDSLARGRGLFHRGNVAPADRGAPRPGRGPRLAVPFDLPTLALNRWSVAAFNRLYHLQQTRDPGSHTVHYEPFFYPLDGVRRWNRIYGRSGFLEFQCVLPQVDAQPAITEILDRARREVPSFLTVLKTFGDVPSPGLMSWPRPGVTLVLDFANRGPRTLRLLDELEVVVRRAGGGVYPAKDARMSAESYAAYFTHVRRFEGFVDPAFSSSFWRRVNPRAATRVHRGSAAAGA